MPVRKLFIILLLFFPGFMFGQRIHFDAIDQKALNIPLRYTSNPDTLSKYLTLGCENDLEKFRSIFVWVAHYIEYDVDAYVQRDYTCKSLNEILNSRLALCQGYADLLQALCKSAGIECQKIEGYCKGVDYFPGRHFSRAEHVWNAVQLGNNWYLSDITWAAGGLIKENKAGFLNKLLKKPAVKYSYRFVKSFNSNYFMTEPKAFIYDHLPSDPVWQLLPCYLPIDSFEKGTNAIRSFIEINNNCAYSTDSITVLSKASYIDQKLIPAQRALRYNPSNYQSLIFAYIEAGNAELEMAESLNIQDTSVLKVRYTNALSLLNKAAELLELDVRQISSEQQEVIGNIKATHKQRIKSYNGYLSRYKKTQSLLKKYIVKTGKSLADISKTIEQLQNQNNTLSDDDKIYNINRPKNEPDSTAFSLIARNAELLKSNDLRMLQLRREAATVYDSTNWAIFSSIKTKRDTIIRDYSFAARNSDSLQALISEMDPYFETLISKISDKLQKLNDSSQNLHSQIDLLQNAVLKENSKQIKSLSALMFALLKEDKKMLTEIKSRNPGDLQEDFIYDDLNQSYIEENEKMIDRFTQLITKANSEAKNANAEFSLLNKNVQAITRLLETQKISFSYRLDYFNTYYKSLQINNKQESRYCNNLRNRCLQHLKKLSPKTK
jgi:hypothetical protein